MIESTITFDSRPVQYIPALGFKRLTPIFDPFLRWVAKEMTFKAKLLKYAEIKEDWRILDLGCGTGTLTILLKETYPKTEIIGIDIDPDVLEIAKTKANRAGASVRFDKGTAFKMPYPDNSFDQVVSSLVFHHLTSENKIRTLREILRILKPTGKLIVADFGRPQNIAMRLASAVMRRLEESEDNFRGLLAQMFKVAGFDNVEESNPTLTIFGTVVLYKGTKPAPSTPEPRFQAKEFSSFRPISMQTLSEGTFLEQIK